MLHTKLTLSSGVELWVYSRENFGEIDINRVYPTVLVVPGGGYTWVSEREGEPVALGFFGQGFNAAVLKYTAPARYPTQLTQVREAVRTLRERAREWNIDPRRLAVCGFSAGGHLAGCSGLFFEEEIERPDAMVLSYPVISGVVQPHQGSFDTLLGEAADEALLHKLSLENSVRDDTPPAFVWSTFDDDCVPVENSLAFARALREKNVACELHIFESGAHGLAMCDESVNTPNADVGQWFWLAVQWLRKSMG